MLKKIFLYPVLITLFLSIFPIAGICADQEVTFAMLPQMSVTEVYKCWSPILEYLEKETGIHFNQVYPKDFSEHVAMCREGKIDFAYSNPMTYIKMSPRKDLRASGHKAILLALEPQGATFYGEFIVRVDNENIKTIADIKGKNGWVVGYDSAGGFTFQYDYALMKGIDLEKDCNLTVAEGNKQGKVVTAVFNHLADFGCVRSGMLEKMKDRVDLGQLRVLAKTDSYPSWVFSAQDKVDPQIVAKITQALLKIPADVLEKANLPGKVKGFQVTTDADLDSMRKLADRIKFEY